MQHHSPIERFFNFLHAVMAVPFALLMFRALL
jgi:hypothetical protein